MVEIRKKLWILCLIFMISLSASSLFVSHTSAQIEENISGTGTVRYATIEGGFYYIASDDGENYDPYNTLPTEFRIDGLRVRFEVITKPSFGGVHMFGTIVDIISIEMIDVAQESISPIRINSDSDFISQGWPGSGTEVNPWIVENFDINGTGYGYCIYIGNVSGSFIVRNCYLHDASGNPRGFHRNSGLFIYMSDKATIQNNTFERNEYHGILSMFSERNTINNNTMIENGISFDGYDYWNSHLIDISNTVNGRPVYYWKNKNGGTVPAGAGQVILANCSNIIVENQNLSDCSYGITLGHSSNNTIKHNNVSLNNLAGIFLYESDNNTIENNTASLGNTGIQLSHSDGNSIFNNVANWNNYYGIFLFPASNNIIDNNTVFSNNSTGIYVNDGDRNEISYNNISNNAEGITIWHSHQNSISNNKVNSNNMYGLLIRGVGNVISNNSISYNEYGIYLWDSGNWIYHNSIINNTIQAYDQHANFWNTSSSGNFWEDYNGTDNNGDGIGDTPYSIIGGSNEDNYPLMEPYNGQCIEPLNQDPLNQDGDEDFFNNWMIIVIVLVSRQRSSVG